MKDVLRAILHVSYPITSVIDMFHILRNYWKKIRANAALLSWETLLYIVIAHMGFTWLLLLGCGEQLLVGRDSFFYFYMTTALTVGYGDLSPKTEYGRLVTALWLMPGGISITAALIGKIGGNLISFWRMGMNGKRSYTGKYFDHTVIVGWNPPRTMQMIKLLLPEMKKDETLVLVASDEMENPFPEDILFVRGETCSSDEVLNRAAITEAKNVIVYGKSDEETLTIALSVAALNPKAHIVAHFEDTSKATLLKRHCHGVETLSDITIEMLIRSTRDPGSSIVTAELVGNATGPTQYRAEIPARFVGMTGEQLFVTLKAKYDATLIGVSVGDSHQVTLNPPFQSKVHAGTMFYIASGRVDFESKKEHVKVLETLLRSEYT